MAYPSHASVPMAIRCPLSEEQRVSVAMMTRLLGVGWVSENVKPCGDGEVIDFDKCFAICHRKRYESAFIVRCEIIYE